jgi:hypothetical protein
MTMDHIEIQINQSFKELFKKYLTLLSVERIDNENSQIVQAKSGFYDANKT